MGLVITNNVSSLTAQNNLNRTSNMLSKSLERLSSGLKINRGADGPAALVISEQQRGQIAGLRTAIDNISKAVSMVQTTEGALNEINSLLTKIRSLALDSANSAVNDSNALAANQSEVSNALLTIDRIATNTQFGTKKILDGTLGVTVTSADVVNANIESQFTTGLTNSGLPDDTYQLKITTAYAPAVAAVAAASTSAINVTAGAGTDFFNTAASGGGTDVDAGAVQNGSFFTDSGFLVVGNQSYAYDATVTVGSVLTTINADNNSRFTVTLNDANSQFTVTAKTAGAADNGVQVQFLGATNGGNLTATSNGANAIARVDAAGEIVDSSGNSLASPILLTVKSLSDGTVLRNSALNIEFDVDNTAAQSTGLKGDVFSTTSSGNAAVFQIGANAGQTAQLSVQSVLSSALGTGIVGNLFASLSAIDVTTAAGAEDSIGVIDQAINEISVLRANLGAFQQATLESTANNLRSTLENTIAAESVIRDTDFAVETANFTKAQVLMQVGTTVLQNANAISQLVVNLVRG